MVATQVYKERVDAAQQVSKARIEEYNQFIEEQRTTSVEGPAPEPDWTVEPKDGKPLVWLEGRIIKELFPAYQTQKDAITPLENELEIRLAYLKAFVVGKGREGKWTQYVKTKGDLIPVTLRTLDRWIRRAVESGSLPAWVRERLKPKKLSSKKIKISVQLVFDNEDDKNRMQHAVKELTKEKLGVIVLKAVRAELDGRSQKSKKTKSPTAESTKSARDQSWTPERKKAHGESIKAALARKKASTRRETNLDGLQPYLTKLPPMHGQDRQPPTDKPNEATDAVVARLLHRDGVDGQELQQ